MTHTVADRITLPEARYLALLAQHLEHPDPRGRGKPTQDEILAAIRASGCLQLDSISVVSRAHETAVWSRFGSYDPSDLAALHYPRKELIEYWAHAASLLPVEFFPNIRSSMVQLADPGHRVGQWAHENRALLNDVLRTIEREGPVSTRAFDRPEEIKRNPWDWWGGKPAKQALDHLWTLGELVVLRRAGFERVYELTDRAFPQLRSANLPTPEEESRFFTRRALTAVGVGTLPWIADYFRCGSGRFQPVSNFRSTLHDLAHEGSAIPVEIEGIVGPGWLDAAFVPHLDAFRSRVVRPNRKTLLSPFDNLLWRRERALALFGFDYRLESYTPEPKRIYGYYSLPILIEGRLVGRLDARYRRKERRMSVQSIHLEPGVRPSKGLADSIARVLREFTAFLGGGEIEVLKTAPESFCPMIARQLN